MKYSFCTFYINKIATSKKDETEVIKFENIEFPEGWEPKGEPIVTVTHQGIAKVSFLCIKKDKD